VPKLKVFTTQMGFYDLAVAASSQAKALEAWGVHQNLFAQGMAHVTTDGALVDAALARPNVVLRRPVGSKEPFSEHASVGTRIAKASPSKAKTSRPAKKAKKAKKARHGRS